ncbi:MAG TPA: folate-binding protein [Gallionella sp.]|nr:MAG: folate-binding protein [Gallionellales bacterium GWA2_54_124]OGT45360.1 MAG: folate-binding protein [Gallionellales bacterium RIFOXYD2_FULL_52_7]HCI51898.1 folate-binding protein [Gallionella sp.]
MTIGHTDSQTGTTLCNLSQFATLRVSGSDAHSFLQNLLSNDIREVSATQAQYSSFNTAKGRMLASFLIWRDADDYLLQLPEALSDALRKKLGMYVLRAKVKITDARNEVISLGLSGLHPALPATCLELPVMGVIESAELACSIIKIGDARFMLNCAPEQQPQLVAALNSRIIGSDTWDWLNIRAGTPVILPRTQEQFVPQMVNFDLIGGINFKKGCYPGQEIVARMHYLGKPKRRMYLAHSLSEANPGDELYSEEMIDQACGMIVNAAPAPTGGFDVLAVVQITSRAAHPVHVHSLQGPVLAFESLPYPLP